MLNQLLNDMDGLAPEARMLFVLTTNRPEVLEPALAVRPGRVDQVIEIGLPGEGVDAPRSASDAGAQRSRGPGTGRHRPDDR